jgi:hypothetical protein
MLNRRLCSTEIGKNSLMEIELLQLCLSESLSKKKEENKFDFFERFFENLLPYFFPHHHVSSCKF